MQCFNFRCVIVVSLGFPALFGYMSLNAGDSYISDSYIFTLLTDKLAVQVQSLYRARQAAM